MKKQFYTYGTTQGDSIFMVEGFNDGDETSKSKHLNFTTDPNKAMFFDDSERVDLIASKIGGLGFDKITVEISIEG